MYKQFLADPDLTWFSSKYFSSFWISELARHILLPGMAKMQENKIEHVMILKVQEWNYTLRLNIAFISSRFTGQSKWKAWGRFNGWEKYFLRFRKTTGIWHGEMDTGEKVSYSCFIYINCFIFLPLVPTLEWNIICVHLNLLLCLPKNHGKSTRLHSKYSRGIQKFFFSSEMRETSKTILCYILGISLKCLAYEFMCSIDLYLEPIIEAIICIFSMSF